MILSENAVLTQQNPVREWEGEYLENRGLSAFLKIGSTTMGKPLLEHEC